MKIKLVQAFVMALCLYAAAAGAIGPSDYAPPTDAEIAALPPYCPSRLRGPSDEHFMDWSNTMGPIFEHVHHYCLALNNLSRYYKSSDPHDRGFFLGEVLGNIDYVTRITGQVQRSALMPEIYLTKGRALLLEHRDAEAANAFLHAIQLKPDYADPYAAMADFYVRLENKQDALKILQEGLRQIPSSRSLARRYQKLGGKLPLPDLPPAVTEVSKPEPQPSVPAETEKQVVNATPVATPQTSGPEQAPPNERPSEKIGSPSNPWCRFCTDDQSAPAIK